MTEMIDLSPQELNLTLYSGDGVRLPLHIVDKDDADVNLSGGDFESQIRLKRGTTDTPSAEFSIDDSDATTGHIVLSLTGIQTQALTTTGKKFKGVWDIQWTAPSAEPRTILQGTVECDPDVSR